MVVGSVSCVALVEAVWACGGSSDDGLLLGSPDGGDGAATSSGATSSGASGSSGTSGTSSGSAGSSGGTSGTSGGSTDGGGVDGSDGGGANLDGGAPTFPDGAKPSNAGKITCGPLECTSATDECCVQGGGGGGTPSYKCQPKGQACTFGSERECDEKADCANGACCLDVQAAGFGDTVCRASCTNGERQLCRTDGECAGGKCFANYCRYIGFVQSCERLAFCDAGP
jgi:hypothetical protein